ncbi:hypothetical protein [Conexibacter sp. CPCC 206217]|uniref:hypothetical protein n=1 Tax=Conexibacter sp. CPCC 206217 TaxID=3064574 RepID=UPI002727399C|nr:hypothetical protein [Conexibacter sp. CPCC 206217]MDO8213766.1 hypothetical protein [Conexibacter sp. CPCC 206217]
MKQESDQVLMVQVGFSGFSDGMSWFSACLKPDGAWRTLDFSSWSKYFDGRSVGFATAGSQVGWYNQDDDHGGTPRGCAVWRVDLASALGPQQVPMMAAGGPDEYCASAIAIARNGTLAWIAGDVTRYPVALDRPDQLNVIAADGSVVALDSGLPGTLTQLTLAPDGGTVRWLRGGVQQSAAL